MAAEKVRYEYETDYSTDSFVIVTNENKNGFVYNVHYSVDYNEEYESYGYVDYKGHYVANQEQYNSIFKWDGEHPFHDNSNMWDF